MDIFHKKIKHRQLHNNIIKNEKCIFPNKRYFSTTLNILSILNILCVGEVFAQLPDNGFRDDSFNNNGYNSGSVSQGSQTILEVVKSINYLSEVRHYFSFCYHIKKFLKISYVGMNKSQHKT